MHHYLLPHHQLVLRLCCALLLHAGRSLSAELLAAAGPPFSMGTHLQLVRRFYTTGDGLPSENIRSLATTRDGAVLAATESGVARLDGEVWIKQGEISEASALFCPRQGPRALAGGTNGVWALDDHRWQLENESPPNVIAFSGEPDGTPWALAPSGVWRREKGWKLIHTIEDDVLAEPHSLLPAGANEALVAAETGLFALTGKRRYWLKLEVDQNRLLSPHASAISWLDREHFLVATDKGFNLANWELGRGWHAFTGREGLPVLNLTHTAVGREGTVWFGSNQGLIRWSNGAFTYLSSKRWLPDDRVVAIAPALDGSVWVGTPKGLSHIFHRKLTLAEKADILQRDLEARERRHGFVTQVYLRSPGVLEGALQEVSDNDGLWTGLYIAAQSFRYTVTKSPQAKAQAWRSMQALLRLESVTGISGFPARAMCQIEEPQFAGVRSHPEWHESSVEKDWFWKGETSSDEIVGHYFAWYVFHELAADDEQKRQVAATCKRVTDHILDHGYYLVDKDGQATTWGFWAPERLNDDPKYWEERCLGSLEMLSHLKVAMHLVGDSRYDRAYHQLIREHHYALNTLIGKLPNAVSHDAQLLFLSYYPLLQLEKEPGLRAIYIDSLKRSWEMVRAEGSPVWNFIYGASTDDSCDVEAAVGALQEMPLDFILWKIRNSQRADIEKFRGKPLPWTERPIHKWDHTPFVLDGGNDLTEGDQTVWLLPYWMGRFHKLID